MGDGGGGRLVYYRFDVSLLYWEVVENISVIFSFINSIVECVRTEAVILVCVSRLGYI